jgi:hypothetical protein
MTNQGKMVELMVVERRIVVSSDEEETYDESDKENKANGERDDERSNGDNGSDDNYNKKSAKEGGYEKKPRPSIKNVVKPEKNNLTWVFKTASQGSLGCNTSKTNKNQNKEGEKDDCPRQQVRCVYELCQNIPKTLNCQILEQKSFFSDVIKNLPTDCTLTKND